MKYLILACLLLVGCGESALEKEVRESISQENLKKGTKYAKTIWGNCYKDWRGDKVVIEEAKEFYVDKNGSQICALNNVCDMDNKSKCVTQKICSRFMRNDYLRLEVEKLKPVKCSNK